MGGMRLPLPTQERLRALFSYEDGELYWLVSPRRGVAPGSRAGTLVKNYMAIGVDGTKYKTHRLIWKWCTGQEPPEHLDHVDGNKLNNRIENLRPISNRANMVRGNRWANKPTPAGVIKEGGRYRSRCWIDGKQKHLGCYGTIEEAAAAYNEALRQAERTSG